MFKLVCSILILIIFTTTISAQQSKNFPRVGVDETTPLMLSLNDAIRMTLESNADIEVERINVQQADADLLSARGSYDPVLSFSQFYTRQNSPVTSALGGSLTGILTTNTLTGDFGLRGLTSSGGNYELAANNTRTDTSNLFATLNPQTSTGISFLFRQPLLRNRKTDDARRRITIAQRRLDISDSLFRQRVIEIISQVERAYWELVFARKNIGIIEESIALADTQLKRAQRLIEAGSEAPVDLVQIEAQRQRRQEDLLVALENVTRAENALKLLMLPSRQAIEWQRAVVPTDLPEVKPVNFELNATIAGALTNRPEIRQLENQLEITNEDIKYYRDQSKPQVDFVISYNLAGLAGSKISRNNPLSSANTNAPFFARINQISQLLNLDPVPLPPATSAPPGFLVGGIGQSLSDLFQNKFNTFRVGIQLQLPLRNRTVAGQLARSQFEGRKNTIQKQRLEEVIESEVRNALQSVRTTQERIQAAAAGRVAAERQLESEQRRYESGLSTNFLVLTRQQELAEARGRELRALTDYDKALSELQRVTGATLTTHAVDVQPPRNEGK